MSETLGFELSYQYENCMLYGYFNRKGFLTN
jgi:hypothetical protein